jgi:hypothetical protein
LVEHIEDTLSALGVDTDGGFIEEEDSWCVHNTACDIHTAFHAAGELGGQVIGSVFERDPF